MKNDYNWIIISQISRAQQRLTIKNWKIIYITLLELLKRCKKLTHIDFFNRNLQNAVFVI
jgi:hypothetical protein